MSVFYANILCSLNVIPLLCVRMSFVITGQGEVTSVRYQSDEPDIVITLKKILLGTLSSRLLVTNEQAINSGQMWLYQVNETGHEGNLYSKSMLTGVTVSDYPPVSSYPRG